MPRHHRHEPSRVTQLFHPRGNRWTRQTDRSRDNADPTIPQRASLGRRPQSAHPVYKFSSFADAAGQPIAPPGADPAKAVLKGVVAALHFARHGEPNGVVLETGEFIHLRPHGMALLGLGVGAAVRAVGELRLTALGQPMLEARQVNRIVID